MLATAQPPLTSLVFVGTGTGHRTEGAEDAFAQGLGLVLTKLPPFTLSTHLEVQERVRADPKRRGGEGARGREEGRGEGGGKGETGAGEQGAGGWGHTKLRVFRPSRFPWFQARFPWFQARFTWFQARFPWFQARFPWFQARSP